MRYLVTARVKPGRERALAEAIEDAHARTRCRDLNGHESRACSNCDCTEKLEARLAAWGPRFLDTL